MALATVEDVTDRLGKPAEEDLAKLITRRLGDAERMIVRAFRDKGIELDVNHLPADLDAEDLKQAEAEMVLRLARNPEGYFSETDGNYTYQLRQDLSTGVLELTPDDRELLGLTQTGMFVIDATLELRS